MRRKKIGAILFFVRKGIAKYGEKLYSRYCVGGIYRMLSLKQVLSPKPF